MCWGFFSADIILVCGNDESSLLRGHFAVFLFSDSSDCSFAGEVDDVLDCFCLLHHCRNAHRHCSFLVSSLVVCGSFACLFCWVFFKVVLRVRFV